jgi:hypothetical protein
MHHLLTPETLRLTMGLAFFPLGLFSVIAGLLILVAGPYRQEAKVLAQQSARIGQKGLTGDITLVTQSATALVDAVNSLIRTSSGNAVVLVVVGALLEAAAYWLLVKV